MSGTCPTSSKGDGGPGNRPARIAKARQRSAGHDLAGDQQVTMRMAPGNVVVGAENVEPIVPLGPLISDLGCSMQWTEDHLTIHHRVKGMISTFLSGGCPMVSKDDALALIAELEGRTELRAPEVAGDDDSELLQWLERLTTEHPAFEGIPVALRHELVVTPKPGHLVGKKRLRKCWKKNHNVILHLYAGPDKDMTFKRAAKEMGADERQVVEIDILRWEKWNTLDDRLFSELLYMAFDGQIPALGCPTVAPGLACAVKSERDFRRQPDLGMMVNGGRTRSAPPTSRNAIGMARC